MARLQSIPWARFTGEFLVIVLGVLAALAVDSWRDLKQEEELSQAYLRSLERDLVADSVMLTRASTVWQRKQASLDILLAVSQGGTDLTPDSVATLLRLSTSYGWMIPEGQVSAYKELESTGGLRLISDPELRSDIVSYYEDWRRQSERMDRHRSEYPNSVYALLPHSVLRGGGPVNREAGELIGRLRTQRLRDQVNHEANYAALFEGVHSDFRDQVESLLPRIRQSLR
jgi:hypothetical protein